MIQFEYNRLHNCDVSFKEGLPSNAVLALNPMSQAWQISRLAGSRGHLSKALFSAERAHRIQS
jgi:hypothetical protein